LPALQHDDLVGQRHRFRLVVGDVDHRRAELLVQAGDLDAHLHAQFGIEVRERLVEQEHLRFAHDGPADGDTLALAAGELFRPPLHQLVDLQDIGGMLDALFGILLGIAVHAQTEAEVLLDRHVRIERIGLENHGDAAIGRLDIVDDLAADVDLAAGDILQSGDHPQQRGLAAAGRADEDDELAVLHLEVRPMDDFERAEALDHVVQ
jgi:hypothetical protein